MYKVLSVYQGDDAMLDGVRNDMFEYHPAARWRVCAELSSYPADSIPEIQLEPVWSSKNNKEIRSIDYTNMRWHAYVRVHRNSEDKVVTLLWAGFDDRDTAALVITEVLANLGIRWDDESCLWPNPEWEDYGEPLDGKLR